MEQDQRPVMETATPQQRQAISNGVQSTLQMLADFDLKLYGEVSAETLEAVQTQGFVLQNGIIQKAESARTETVQREQMAVNVKPSVRGQLRNAAKEAGQRLHSEGRPKGDEAR